MDLRVDCIVLASLTSSIVVAKFRATSSVLEHMLRILARNLIVASGEAKHANSH